MATSKPRFPSDEDYARAGAELAVDPLLIKAFAAIEGSKFGGFFDSGHPTALFERHIFSRLTGHQFDTIATDISNKVPGGYGTNADQPLRIRRAMNLDKDAALCATSWGIFQLLGLNYRSCGFETVGLFVQSMWDSVSNQLNAFVSFVKKAHPRLLEAMQDLDYVRVSELYNGRRQADHDYSGRLRALHQELRAEATRE